MKNHLFSTFIWPTFQGLESVLRSPRNFRKSHSNTEPPVPRREMSAAEREAFILQAIERGVPLNRIEAWLDWLELNQDYSTSAEAQSAAPVVPPPSPHPDAPGTI